MTKYTGNGMVLDWDGDAITSIISVEINEGAATYDTTVAGESAETHLPGKTNGQMTVNLLDNTDGTVFGYFVPGTVLNPVNFYPQGNASGKPKRYFTATVTGRQRPVAHNAATPITVTLQINGAITDTVVTP